MFPSLHTKDERHVKCKAWNVKRRATQGSVLHLMLFNILIDDLSYIFHVKRAKLNAYVDDHLQVYNRPMSIQWL